MVKNCTILYTNEYHKLLTFIKIFKLTSNLKKSLSSFDKDSEHKQEKKCEDMFTQIFKTKMKIVLSIPSDKEILQFELGSFILALVQIMSKITYQGKQFDK